MNTLRTLIIKIPIFLLMVGQWTHTGTIESSKQIAELKNAVKTKHNAHDADEVINALAQDSLKKCGICLPVTILQCNDNNMAYTNSSPLIHPHIFMILGVKDQSLDQIEATIYHEIGHIANGDMSKKRVLQDYYYNQGAKVLSLTAGIVAGLGFYKYKKSAPLASLVGGLSTSATFLVSALLLQYRNSLKEEKADIFAYQKLLQHNKLHTAIGEISDYIYQHEHDPASLPSCVCGYPSKLKRAHSGLSVLQQSGLSIASLIKDLPQDLDEGIKATFPGQVTRNFPQLLL